MAKRNVYIEPNGKGQYAVKQANAQRASALCDTQGEAIAAAKRMFPGARPDVARVRHTKNGEPDQFRPA